MKTFCVDVITTPNDGNASGKDQCHRYFVIAQGEKDAISKVEKQLPGSCHPTRTEANEVRKGEVWAGDCVII